MDSAFDEALLATLAGWRIDVTPEQLDLLRQHFAMLVEANRVMNLTRITDPLEAAVKHYADSLSVLLWVGERRIRAGTVLDVGTGAGFPAVPVAILRPQWRVTALEATGKKLDFVARSVQTLGVSNVRTVHAHSEHWKTESKFDLVLARAVGPLERCLKAGAGFLAKSGRLVVYKTRTQAQAEPPTARGTSSALGVRYEDAYFYELVVNNETMERALLVYSQDKGGRSAGAS